MIDTIRDAPFGQVVRYVTGNRVFQYPEELPGFKWPHSYDVKDEKKEDEVNHHPTDPVIADAKSDAIVEPASVGLDQVVTAPDVENVNPPLTGTSSSSSQLNRVRTLGSHIERTQTLPYTEARLEVEEALAQLKSTSTSRAVAPVRTVDGTILVDW